MLSVKFSKILKPETESEIKRAQIFKAILLGTAFLGIGIAFSTTFSKTQDNANQKSPEETKPTAIESATEQVDLTEIWKHKIEDQTNTIRDQIEDIKEMVQEKAQTPSLDDSEHLTQIQKLETRILELEVEKENRLNSAALYPEGSPVDPFGNPNMDPEGTETTIQKFTLNLTQRSQSKVFKNVETTIPAGSFVQAVLLSGVDAPATLNAKENPLPLNLRLIDEGILPNEFRGKYKGCKIIAAAHASLSSERVEIRLETLTCVDKKTGNIFETVVDGYVAGPDGKEGLRGIVAMKDGELLIRSLLGGSFSGLSNAANPMNRQAQINPFFAGNPQISAPTFGDMFTSGMATGVSSAFSDVAKYYMGRAEQLQPVIQIAAGQVVDIVFQKSVTLGSEEIPEKTETPRAQNDREIETTKLPQTPPMLKGGQP